MDIVLRNVK